MLAPLVCKTDRIDAWVLAERERPASVRVEVAVRGAVSYIVCGPPSAADLGRGCAGYRPGDYNLNRFHPGSEYWTFQLIETGIFVAASALLLLLAFRCLRRMA